MVQGTAERAPDERALSEWTRIALRGWPALVAGVLLGIAITVVATAVQPVRYQAQGSVFVSPRPGFLEPRKSTYVINNVMKTAPGLVWSPLVLEGAARRYAASTADTETANRRKREATPRWVRDHVRANSVSDTTILNVTSEAGSRRDALDLSKATVQAVSASLLGRADEAVRGTRPAPPGTERAVPRDAGLQVRVYSDSESNGRVSPSVRRNALVGLNVGLLLALPAALLLGMRRSHPGSRRRP
jgi:hypothetical protein